MKKNRNSYFVTLNPDALVDFRWENHFSTDAAQSASFTSQMGAKFEKLEIFSGKIDAQVKDFVPVTISFEGKGKNANESYILDGTTSSAWLSDGSFSAALAGSPAKLSYWADDCAQNWQCRYGVALDLGKFRQSAPFEEVSAELDLTEENSGVFTVNLDEKQYLAGVGLVDNAEYDLDLTVFAESPDMIPIRGHLRASELESTLEYSGFPMTGLYNGKADTLKASYKVEIDEEKVTELRIEVIPEMSRSSKSYEIEFARTESDGFELEFAAPEGAIELLYEDCDLKLTSNLPNNEFEAEFICSEDEIETKLSINGEEIELGKFNFRKLLGKFEKSVKLIHGTYSNENALR